MSRRSDTCRRTWAAALLLLAAGGCGEGMHPVQGKVTFPDGTPMKGGEVVFESDDPNAPVSARGPIREDGTYRMGTRKEADGVPAGAYKVLVVAPLPPNRDANVPAPPPLIDTKFQNFKTSGLQYTVVRGKNEYNITVQRPAARRP